MFSMEPEHLVGNAEYGKMNYDMATVIMVCLGESERREKDILRLLGVLLSPEIRPGTKKKILEQEYGIPMTVEMEKEAETMCDYGRGLARKYTAKGLAKGMQKGMQKEQRDWNKVCNKVLWKAVTKASSRNATAISWACCGEKIPMETIAPITKEQCMQSQLEKKRMQIRCWRFWPQCAQYRPMPKNDLCKLADGELFVNERIVKNGRVLYQGSGSP